MTSEATLQGIAHTTSLLHCSRLASLLLLLTCTTAHHISASALPLVFALLGLFLILICFALLLLACASPTCGACWRCVAVCGWC